MKDNEKQVVYNQIEAGHRSIEDLSCAELRELKGHWFAANFVAMPPIDFDVKIRDEIRRREVQSATKPKPFNKEFFG